VKNDKSKTKQRKTFTTLYMIVIVLTLLSVLGYALRTMTEVAVQLPPVIDFAFCIVVALGGITWIVIARHKRKAAADIENQP
jgi:uncharacterized membrane protein